MFATKERPACGNEPAATLGIQSHVKIVVNGLESYGSLVRTFRFCQGHPAVLSAEGGEDPDVCVTPATTPGGCATYEELTNDPVITWSDLDPTREIGHADPNDPRGFIVDTSLPIEEPVPIVVSAQEPEGDGCRSATPEEGGESSEASALVLVYGSCSGWAGEEDLEEWIEYVENPDNVVWETLTSGDSHPNCQSGQQWNQTLTLYDHACSRILVTCDGSSFLYTYEEIRDGIVKFAFLLGKCIFINGQNTVKTKQWYSYCGTARPAIVAHIVRDPYPCPTGTENKYRHKVKIRNLMSGESLELCKFYRHSTTNINVLLRDGIDNPSIPCDDKIACLPHYITPSEPKVPQ